LHSSRFEAALREDLTDWAEVARFANEVADAVLRKESLAIKGAGRPAEALMH